MVFIYISPGAVLELLPTMNIFENSTMQRSLCVRLVDFGAGLERMIHLNIMFEFNSSVMYSQMSEYILSIAF